MKSRITGGLCSPLFSSVVLGRHSVRYYRCNDTGFIQTEEPYWLKEAYSDAITQLDIGLLGRNLEKVEFSASALNKICPPCEHAQRFLDYGGGYGIFVRLMRDQGFPFELYDPFCNPLFAKNFRLADSQLNVSRFDCVTAWEVFEHLADPVTTFKKLMGLTDNLLFSTVLVPEPVPINVTDWWYFTPETGQHVSFFTMPALKSVARKLGVHCYSDGVANHLFTRQALKSRIMQPHGFLENIRKRCYSRLARWVAPAEREELRTQDYKMILSSLRRTSDGNSGGESSVSQNGDDGDHRG